MKQNKTESKKVIIGVTGGTGAGKSVLCARLSELGADIVDADDISRRVSKKGGSAYGEIVDCFGSGILDEGGEINRRRLGEIVFGDGEKLKKLNSITHKHIFDEMRRRIDESPKHVVVLDVPLLFSSDFPFECDITAAVIADTDIRIDRIVKRDGISVDAAMRRVKSQLTNDELMSLADICIENNGDEGKLKDAAMSIYKAALKKNNREEA